MPNELATLKRVLEIGGAGQRGLRAIVTTRNVGAEFALLPAGFEAETPPALSVQVDLDSKRSTVTVGALGQTGRVTANRPLTEPRLEAESARLKSATGRIVKRNHVHQFRQFPFPPQRR